MIVKFWLAVAVTIIAAAAFTQHPASSRLFFRGGAASPAGSSCGPDPAPAAAAAAGLTCETFSDGPFSLSTIDVNDTGGNFKWYTHNTWPNSVQAGTCPHCFDFNVLGPTPSGDYTIVGGNLVLSKASDAPYGNMPEMLNTCRASASAPGYTGQTFHAPYYVEFIAPTVISSGVISDVPTNIIWMHSTEFFTGGAGATLIFPEFDIDEFPVDQGALFDWQVSGGVIVNSFRHTGTGGNGGSPNPKASMVLDAAHNGGSTGIMKTYINNVEQVGLELTLGPGSFSEMLTDHMCLMVSSGLAGDSLTYSQIRVWQLPP